MGGCCCCFSSRRSEPVRAPTYFYSPRTSEERQPLSATLDGPSGSSPGILVDTNLDTSIPETYTPPPPPVPYETYSGRPQSGDGITYVTKSEIVAEKTADSSTEVSHSVGSPGTTDKEIDGKEQSVLELTPSKDSEDDLKKPVEVTIVTIEEEDCPICLEEYTEENPKMLTKCEHHFHLCCILEWMERSDSCPVCDQEVVMDEELQ